MDKQAVGCPATKDGSDLRLLQRHFTVEHAKMALILSFRFQSAEQIVSKMKNPKLAINEARKLLDSMGAALCIYRRDFDGTIKYALAPLVIGLYEFKAASLTPEYIEDFQIYSDSDPYMLSIVATKVSQMRTIPVEKAITPEHPIATYDQVEHLLNESEGPFIVAECICRLKHDHQGDPCKRTDRREICLAMGPWAEQAHKGGIGRIISKEEAIQILNKNQEEGLVLQPSGGQDAEFICSCCGCCCGMLRMQKQLPHPVDFWTHAFQAKVDMEKCIGCGLCEKKCNVDAIKVVDKKAVVKYSRCIGCGVCVTSCAQQAIELVPIKEPKKIPKTYDDFYEYLKKHKKGLIRRFLMGLKMKKGKHWYS